MKTHPKAKQVRCSKWMFMWHQKNHKTTFSCFHHFWKCEKRWKHGSIFHFRNPSPHCLKSGFHFQKWSKQLKVPWLESLKAGRKRGEKIYVCIIIIIVSTVSLPLKHDYASYLWQTISVNCLNYEVKQLTGRFDCSPTILVAMWSGWHVVVTKICDQRELVSCEYQSMVWTFTISESYVNVVSACTLKFCYSSHCPSTTSSTSRWRPHNIAYEYPQHLLDITFLCHHPEATSHSPILTALHILGICHWVAGVFWLHLWCRMREVWGVGGFWGHVSQESLLGFWGKVSATFDGMIKLVCNVSMSMSSGEFVLARHIPNHEDIACQRRGKELGGALARAWSWSWLTEKFRSPKFSKFGCSTCCVIDSHTCNNSSSDFSTGKHTFYCFNPHLKFIIRQ